MLRSDYNSRSNRYQYKLQELPVADDQLTTLCEQQNQQQQNELLEQLKADLVERIFQLAEEKLPLHKAVMLLLRFEGRTELEIAKFLNLKTASEVHQKLFFTRTGKYCKQGIYRKLKKICLRDSICVQLLKQINELAM